MYMTQEVDVRRAAGYASVLHEVLLKQWLQFVSLPYDHELEDQSMIFTKQRHIIQKCGTFMQKYIYPNLLKFKMNLRLIQNGIFEEN